MLYLAEQQAKHAQLQFLVLQTGINFLMDHRDVPFITICMIYKIRQPLVEHQALFYQHNLSKLTVDASVVSTRKRQKLAKPDSVFDMQTVARKILLLLSVRCRTRRFPQSSPDTIINTINKRTTYAVADRSCHPYHSCS